MAGKIACGLVSFRLTALAYVLGLTVREPAPLGFVFLFPALGAFARLPQVDQFGHR